MLASNPSLDRLNRLKFTRFSFVDSETVGRTLNLNMAVSVALVIKGNKIGIVRIRKHCGAFA